MEPNILFQFVIPIMIVIVGLILSFWTDILRDTALPNKPYSYARVQLMWWTLIIISCYTSYYGIHHELQNLTSSSLVLLGISIGTTTAARIIDNNEINQGIVRSKGHQRFNNMISNIVSDYDGISVSRFQALVFNFVFGLMFITEFLTEDNDFVDFGPMELGLMGISSAAYVGVKLNENRQLFLGQRNQPPSGFGAISQQSFQPTELRDIDERYSNQQTNNQAVG